MLSAETFNQTKRTTTTGKRGKTKGETQKKRGSNIHQVSAYKPWEKVLLFVDEDKAIKNLI